VRGRSLGDYSQSRAPACHPSQSGFVPGVKFRVVIGELSHETNMKSASKSQYTLAGFIFWSRWLQAPLYIGLIVAQGVYVYRFMMELVHLVLDVKVCPRRTSCCSFSDLST
jgi:hypothetical protein